MLPRTPPWQTILCVEKPLHPWRWGSSYNKWAAFQPAVSSWHHAARAGAEPGLQRRPMVDEFDGRGASLEGDFPESGPTGPVELPPAELGNLPEIAQVGLVLGFGVRVQGRAHQPGGSVARGAEQSPSCA